MRFNVFITLFLVSISCAANSLEIKGSVVFLTEYGEEKTIQGNIVRVSNKNCTDGLVKIDGTFIIDCTSEKELDAGDNAVLSIDRPGWTMLTPMKGEITIAKNQAEKSIKLILILNRSPLYKMLFTNKLESEVKKELFIYTVQVLATYNESEAIDVVKRLNFDSAKLGHKSYYERHLKNNMPDNGYLFKVKVGKLRTKPDADALEGKVIDLYNKYRDAFTTLEGY